MTNNSNNFVAWDPVAQIYTGGTVPGATDAEINDLDHLYVFGYGSLCWNPGGVLQTVLCRGRAPHHVRVWAQKSTDHRGTPEFPGIVCTVLHTANEFQQFDTGKQRDLGNSCGGGVTGLIYTIPEERRRECLEELDFREKGGYAREIIPVIREDTGETIQCLLYRGTVDNPAFWPQVVTDLSLAASVMSVATGPSGENHVYLQRLAEFLENHTEDSDDTLTLRSLVHRYRTVEPRSIHFLLGCGSNQHGQLALQTEDALQWESAALHLESPSSSDAKIITNVYAGGGHSAVKTQNGEVYLFGWNTYPSQAPRDGSNLHTILRPLPSILASGIALGFSHTLIIEKGTRKLWGVGDNQRGQVLGTKSKQKAVEHLTTPQCLENERIHHASAGVFHSAVATEKGQAVLFGGIYDRPYHWRPPDGASITQVACGSRHWTVVLDSLGRLWTMGRDNKYGELGRDGDPSEFGRVLLEHDQSRCCLFVECGWSHALALVELADGSKRVWGWGRNDRGQLGTGSNENQHKPILLNPCSSPTRTICCGSESSIVVSETDEVYACGWNEHGNLGWQNSSLAEECSLSWKRSLHGSTLVTTPGHGDAKTHAEVAVGGAHVLAIRVASDVPAGLG